MELRQIRYFIALAENLHFSKTADKLGIAQSALSVQLKNLERELGYQLIKRENKWNTALTAAGAAFLEGAKKLMRDAESMRLSAARADRGEIGKFSICAVHSFLSSPKVSELLRDVLAKFPNVYWEIHQAVSENALKMVQDGEADIGIVRISKFPNIDAVKSLELWSDVIVAVMSKKHPMASVNPLRLQDLRGETFVMPSVKSSPFFRREIDNMCMKLGGFIPNVRVEADDLYTMLNLLVNTENITLLHESFAFTRYPELTFKRLERCPMKMANTVIWRADNASPILGNFLKALKSTIRDSRQATAPRSRV